jgi:hypothetical protein
MFSPSKASPRGACPTWKEPSSLPFNGESFETVLDPALEIQMNSPSKIIGDPTTSESKGPGGFCGNAGELRNPDQIRMRTTAKAI